MKDWEQNPHLYLTDSDGGFILKNDGTPRKKGGRPVGATSNYQYSNAQKAKNATRRAFNKKRKAIEKIERQLDLISGYEDKLSVLKKYFKDGKSTPNLLND